MQSKVQEKELELETKFDSRLRQLQSLQQTLLEKLSESEQRAATLQFGMLLLLLLHIRATSAAEK